MTSGFLHHPGTDAEIIPIGITPDAGPGATLTTTVAFGRLIGRGATGAVHEAHDPVLQRTIAVKVLLPGAHDASAAFLDEAVHGARVAHPHILPIIGTGIADGAPCYAMPLVAGGSLADASTRVGRVEPRALALITRQLARALDALHAAGLVHRDVKPANVLLVDPDDVQPHAYLTDFGAGLALHSVTHGVDAPRPLGTLGFAAPEQLDGRPTDARTDVFGLGATVYYALTGEHPVPTVDGIAPVTDLRPDLDPSIDAALGRALAVDPAARYASAGAAAEAMAEPLSRGTRPTLVGPTLRATTSQPPKRRRWSGRGDGEGPGRRTLVIATVLAVLLALGALVMLLRPFGSSGRSSRPADTTSPTASSAPGVTPADAAAFSEAERDLLRSVPTSLRAQCKRATRYDAQASLTCSDPTTNIVTTYWQFADGPALDRWYTQFTAMFPVPTEGTCADGRGADTTWRARKADPAPAGRLRCSTMPGFSTVMWTTTDLRIFAAAKHPGDLVTVWKWWQSVPGPVRP